MTKLLRTLPCLAMALAAAIGGMAAVRWFDVRCQYRQHPLCPPVVSETSQFYGGLSAQLRRLDRSVQQGDIIFLGDSHFQGMNVGAFAPRAVNFAIGGETTAGLLERMRTYRAVRMAGVAVLSIGFNDLLVHEVPETIGNVRQILAMLPSPVVLSAIPPADPRRRPDLNPDLNKKIADYNEELARICTGRCTFVSASAFSTDPSGNLVQHEGDGIHLNPAGYAAWSAALDAALKSLSNT